MIAADVNRRAGTVDAGHQRRRQGAKSEFTGIKVASKCPAFCRVHIGDEDFRDMALVNDAAIFVAIVETCENLVFTF